MNEYLHGKKAATKKRCPPRLDYVAAGKHSI